MTPKTAARVIITIATPFALAASCDNQDTELPPVAQPAAHAPELTPPPMSPTVVQACTPIPLSQSERAAIEALRSRGASITVFRGSGEILVHFPLGQLERKWRKDGVEQPECGMSIEYSFTPDASGPPMTDADLGYLEALPRLARVNLGGTQVTAKAIRDFRQKHPKVTVEEKDDE